MRTFFLPAARYLGIGLGDPGKSTEPKSTRPYRLDLSRICPELVHSSSVRKGPSHQENKELLGIPLAKS